jgi:dihydrofolate reductase
MINDSTTYAPCMAKLIYSAITSLDGYVADKEGNFDWAAPGEEVHAFVNQLERSIGTHLFGRRMYETMVYWETAHTRPDSSPVELDYAEVWQAADKIVYSRTMADVSSARTRIEREFDPDSVRELKQRAGRDLSVGGAELGAQAIKADLVDEYHLFVNPVVVGGGTSALPDDIRLDLELLDEHRFASGVVHLHYRQTDAKSAAS